MKIFSIFISIAIIVLLSSCNDKDHIYTGNVAFTFHHVYSDSTEATPFVFFQKYTTNAGDTVMFTELQYFISDISIEHVNGEKYQLSQNNFAHYVDADSNLQGGNNTMTWSITDNLPLGVYKSITFTFGIINAKNVSGIFPNQPEANMSWPETMGGGYHYMILNGKWKDTTNPQYQGFGFHLGKIKDNNDFIDNSFTVRLNKKFSVMKDHETKVPIIMNVKHWFNNPVWRFDEFGGTIMEDAAAQQTARMNGDDVFQ